MKRLTLVSLFICLVCAVALCACGQAGQQGSSGTQYADAQFIRDLSKALEARWSIVDQQVETSDQQKENLTKGVNTELDLLKNYTSAQFEDSTLQEKAIKYINCLKDQQSALEYYSVDSTKYHELWSAAYNARTQLIKDFVDNYGLTVSSANESTLKDLITNANLVNDQEKTQKAVDDICSSMTFEKNDRQYVAVVENTSGVSFKSFSIDINLLDADGIILETDHDSISNWEAGQKAKFDFYTQENFEKASVKCNHWEAAK